MGELVSITSAFQAFPKIARLQRDAVVTEKIDGTNAQVYVVPLDDIRPVETGAVDAVCSVMHNDVGYAVFAGSRNRWLKVGKGNDNHGFAGWVQENAEELVKLGPGRHFGEWWGKGIQSGYGLSGKRFSLFNTWRWISREPTEYQVGMGTDVAPACCHVVPVLYRGPFDTAQIDATMRLLREKGSIAAPGFVNPEGIIVYHTAANVMFKRTLENDEIAKSQAQQAKAA